MPLMLKTVIRGFLAWGNAALAKGTMLAYKHHLDKFLKHVKNKQVARLRPLHLSAWAKSWHECQAVIRLFNWAVDEAALLKKNPFARVKMPCRKERKRILSPREIPVLLRGCPKPGRSFLLAMRESFARPQEIRLAEWDDVVSEVPGLPIAQALANGLALIVLTEFKDRQRRKESSRPRVLLISKRLGRLLLRLRSRAGELDGPIFRNSRGAPWTSNAVRCLMRRLRARLHIDSDKRGENVVAYTFRHSCATFAASKGITDRLLADILGHVETRTTSRYLHLQVSHLRAALDRLTADRISARKIANPKL